MGEIGKAIKRNKPEDFSDLQYYRRLAFKILNSLLKKK